MFFLLTAQIDILTAFISCTIYVFVTISNYLVSNQYYDRNPWNYELLNDVTRSIEII